MIYQLTSDHTPSCGELHCLLNDASVDERSHTFMPVKFCDTSQPAIMYQYSCLSVVSLPGMMHLQLWLNIRVTASAFMRALLLVRWEPRSCFKQPKGGRFYTGREIALDFRRTLKRGVTVTGCLFLCKMLRKAVDIFSRQGSEMFHWNKSHQRTIPSSLPWLFSVRQWILQKKESSPQDSTHIHNTSFTCIAWPSEFRNVKWHYNVI